MKIGKYILKFLFFIIIFIFLINIIFFIEINKNQDLKEFFYTNNLNETKYTQKEIIHLKDVKKLSLYSISFIFLILSFYFYLFNTKKLKINKKDIINYNFIFITLIIILIFNFETTFKIFHKIFFQENTYLFSNNSILIKTYSYNFFLKTFTYIFLLYLIFLIIFYNFKKIQKLSKNKKVLKLMLK